MSRYADLWPKVFDWVEWIATNEDGEVVLCELKPWSIKERHPASWGWWDTEGKISTMQTTRSGERVKDWHDTAEQRPEEHRR
jgi:hypothetical protein